MNQPAFTMFIRGHEYAIEGFIERGDPSVGLFGDGFIYDRLISMETGQEPSQEFYDSLTEGEQIDISDAYYDNQSECTVRYYSWREAELERFYETGIWPEDEA